MFTNHDVSEYVAIIIATVAIWCFLFGKVYSTYRNVIQWSLYVR